MLRGFLEKPFAPALTHNFTDQAEFADDVMHFLPFALERVKRQHPFRVLSIALNIMIQ